MACVCVWCGASAFTMTSYLLFNDSTRLRFTSSVWGLLRLTPKIQCFDSYNCKLPTLKASTYHTEEMFVRENLAKIRQLKFLQLTFHVTMPSMYKHRAILESKMFAWNISANRSLSQNSESFSHESFPLYGIYTSAHANITPPRMQKHVSCDVLPFLIPSSWSSW